MEKGRIIEIPKDLKAGEAKTGTLIVLYDETQALKKLEGLEKAIPLEGNESLLHHYVISKGDSLVGEYYDVHSGKLSHQEFHKKVSYLVEIFNDIYHLAFGRDALTERETSYYDVETGEPFAAINENGQVFICSLMIST